MRPPTALVVLADGFEEIEAMVPADVLSRAAFSVDFLGLPGPECRGAHDFIVKSTVTLEDMTEKTYDVIILPGGLPGAPNIAKNAGVVKLLKKQAQEGRWIAAICASPALVLAEMKLMGNAKGVCYPGMEDRMGDHFAGPHIDVHVDGKISEYIHQRSAIGLPLVTSRGPATAMEWSIRIIKELLGEARAKQIADGLLFKC